MANVIRINPFDFFTDTQGDALDGGFVWIGEPNKDPRQFPIIVYYDEALTIPAAMPLRTTSGYVVRNGAPAFLFVNGNYSIMVRDKKNRQIFYVPTLTGVRQDTVAGTVAELRTLDPTLYNSAEVLKYSADAPWYVGTYLFDALDTTSPDNGGTIIVGVSGSRWKLVSPLLISPEIFGAVGNNVADDFDPLSRFFTALIEGKSGTARPEARYKVNSVITKTLTSGQSIRWDMNGAKIMQGGNNVMLSMLNSNDGAIVGVNAPTQVAVNLGNGAVNTVVMRIEGGAHPFTEPGQIGKIFSDDLVPDSDASNQFCGEYFVVGSIESATVFYTTGIFDETYTSGIKVVRPATPTININNLAGESVWSDAVNASMFTFSGFLSPKFQNVNCLNANAAFLNLTGNYQAEVNTAVGKRLKNRPDLGAFGYFINDSAGWGTTVRGIDCVYARHAYTTTTPSTDPGDDKWWLRGRTIGSIVTDGRGQGCANAFDTHSPALRIKFINCTPVDDFRGFDTGGAGIQIRGNDCQVIDCDTSQSKIGISQSGASKTTNCTLRITGFNYEGPTGHTPVVFNGSSTFSTTIEFDGNINTKASPAMDVTNALVLMTNTSVVIDAASVGVQVVRLNAGGDIRWNGGSVAFRSGTVGRIVAHNSTNTTAYVDNLRVTGIAGQVSSLATSNAAFSIVSRFRGMQLDAALPGVAFTGTEAVSPQVSAEYTIGFNTQPLAYRETTVSVAGNTSVAMGFSGHPVVYNRFNVTIAGVNLNTVTQGAFAGQQLVLNNISGSTNNLTVVDNPAGGLSMGASAVLTPGRGMTLVWDGALWRSAIIQ